MKGLYLREKIWWIRIYVHGSLKRLSTRTSDKELAERIYWKIKTQITEGRFFEIQARETTFKELSDGLIADYKVNQRKSVDRVERSISHLETYFAGMKSLDISTSSIQTYILQR